MWNLIQLWALPGVFLVGSISGLMTCPSDERWIFIVGLLIGLAGAWAALRQMITGEDGSTTPGRTYVACQWCGYKDPTHPLDRCHFCPHPSKFMRPNCGCQKCSDALYESYAG